MTAFHTIAFPIVIFAAGLALVLISVLDVFQTVIVPRPTGRRWRPSSLLARWTWFVWRWIGHRIVKSEQREDFLGIFAPFLLISMLAYWIVSLIVGYGCIFYAFADEIKPVPDFGSSLYFAGTSLLTIGYGDFAPHGSAVRIASLCAGASGLLAFAIITAFLFAIFGAYQTREAFVVLFTNRAGAPPSAVDLLETAAALGTTTGLVETMRESQLWLAQVLETHLAYPVLMYFRSTHDDISWIAVVGTILDASTLAITTLDLKVAGEATILNRLGRHFVNDFARFFELEPSASVGIERGEFDAAYDRFKAVGLPMNDRERAWTDFSKIRAGYAGHLNSLAGYRRIPPAAWVGDRSIIAHHPPLEIASQTRDGATTSRP